MTAISPWLIAIFSSKLLLYIAYAMSVGGIAATFMIQRYKPQQGNRLKDLQLLPQ